MIKGVRRRDVEPALPSPFSSEENLLRPADQGPIPMPLLPSRLLDRIDDFRARRMRADLGARRWLLSWSQDLASTRYPWLARVSCPELPLTIERRGRSRIGASVRAQRALERLLLVRVEDGIVS